MSGCSIQRQHESSKKNIKKTISEHYPNSNSKLICNELDNALYFTSDFSYFATKNQVYQLNKKQLYSNNQNCSEVEIENLDSEIVEFTTANQIETKEQVYTYTSTAKLFSHYTYDGDGVKSIFGLHYGESIYKRLSNELSTNISFYSLYTRLKGYDGIIYSNDQLKLFSIKYNNSVDGEIEKIIFTDIASNLVQDETIIAIQDNIIKTNKAFYEVKAYKTNKEKCEKYADIECEYVYKLTKDEFLTKNYNYIKYAGKDNVIDIYNNYYTTTA